jgi:hypothetical protein
MPTKQVLKMTSLIIYARCGPLRKWSNRLHNTGFVIFSVWTEATIMQFNSSALPLDFTAYTRDFIHPHEFGQVTSVPKQLDPVAKSNGSENGD